MEILDLGVAAALVLLGVAAMLYGAATLYRSVTDAEVQRRELELELDSRARASERFRERVARDREHGDLLQALIPVGAALVGHWLGRQGTPEPDPIAPPCRGPTAKAPTDDDDADMVDLLVDALGELWLNNWLTSQLLNGKAAKQASAPRGPEHVQASTPEEPEHAQA